jgi:hypothetical protein
MKRQILLSAHEFQRSVRKLGAGHNRWRRIPCAEADAVLRNLRHPGARRLKAERSLYAIRKKSPKIHVWVHLCSSIRPIYYNLFENFIVILKFGPVDATFSK